MEAKRRSERHRSEKYADRAKQMLENYYWEREERYFLILMQTQMFTIEDLRRTTWAQVRSTFDGLMVRDQLIPLKDEFLEGFQERIQEGLGFYDEALDDSEGSPLLFRKETMKSITKELDQFK